MMVTAINAQSDEEDAASGPLVLLSTETLAMCAHVLEVGRRFETQVVAEDFFSGWSVLSSIGKIALHVHEVGRGSVTVAVSELKEQSSRFWTR